MIHALRHPHVALVRGDLHAGVQESIQLSPHRVDHSFPTMADVEAADTPGKIQIAVAVDVFEPGVFRLGNIDGSAVRKPAGHGFRPALGKNLRLGAWY